MTTGLCLNAFEYGEYGASECAFGNYCLHPVTNTCIKLSAS